MAVYRPTGRGKIFWMDFVFAAQRIRESTHTSSRTLAKRIEAARRRGLEEAAAGVRRQARPKLVSVAAEDWITQRAPKWTASTLEIHRRHLGHLLPVFGGQLACDIEAADIHRYQQQRLDQKASRRTINMEIGTLRSVLKKARRWALIQEDVTLFPEDHNGKGRKLSPPEQEALLRAAGESRSPALLPFVVLALATGARFGTIRTLTWGQVDFKARAVKWGHDKTEAGSGRIVPLTERAATVLEHWAAQFPRRQPGHYVFPRMRIGGAGRRGPQGARGDAAFAAGCAYATDPTQPVGEIKEAWEAAKKRAGVACRFHDLRHTAASRMMDAGVPLPKVAKILGWKPSTMALMAARYGHFDLEDLRSAVEAGAGPAAAGIASGSPNFPPNFSEAKAADLAN